MRSIRTWMLGAAVVAGVLGLGATTSHAAEVRIYERGPVAYVPPSPGIGYVWAPGYYRNGYWAPGRWNYVGAPRVERFRRYDGRRDFRYDRFRR